MADKLVIEIFKTKNAEDFTKAISTPDCKAEAGSAAAYTAALAAALCTRAAALAKNAARENERIDYILRNADKLREYMVHLIDEDVKSRGPLAKALKEGDARHIEAARQPAACIANEIVNMMGQCLDFMAELAELCPADAMQFLGEGAELAIASIRACRIYLIAMADKCSDETYRFVTRRENEIALANATETYNNIVTKTESAI